MKKTTLILLGIALFTSCKKEEEQVEEPDPCNPYTFTISDGEALRFLKTGNGTVDAGGIYEGCFNDFGKITSDDPFIFGEDGQELYRNSDSTIIWSIRFETMIITHETADSLRFKKSPTSTTEYLLSK